MRVSEWLPLARERLRAAGIVADRLEASLLAAHALGVDRVAIAAHPEWEIDAAETPLARRESGEPLAYILGYREFYGRRFAVTPDVLIPRQETEILVEVTLARAPTEARVLDLGTGSGCIAITLKLERPDLTITASDISSGALAVARANAQTLGADIKLIKSDLFESISESFDAIASNPPYIGREERLPTEVAGFEPEAALFAGREGSEIYRCLAIQARSHLTEDGWMAVEIGDHRLPEIQPIYEEASWTVSETICDLGLMPRVLIVT